MLAYLILNYTTCDCPLDLRSRRDLDDAIADPGQCCCLVIWVIDSGRLSEYALARELDANHASDDTASNTDEGH